MDEVNKEIQKLNIGIELTNQDMTIIIACLLWMDDVVLIADNPKDMQELLNTTDHVSNKCHVAFGKEKSV